MQTEFNTGLPSVRLLQQAIKDKQEVELELLSGSKLAGTVIWQDSNYICVSDANTSILVGRQAIAYIRLPRSR